MKTLKRIKLDEKLIVKRMKESDLKQLKGGLYCCLACGSLPKERACSICYA